jgi:uncharacterized membrane protein
MQETTNRDRDEESGQFKAEYPAADVISAINDLGGRATSPEIADEIGSSRVTAYRKLQRMEEEGEVTSQKIGGIRVWALPDNHEGN